jgi:hypothetical protein
MNNFIQEIIDMEIELSRELGKFNLFTLVELEEPSDRWDLIVSTDKHEKDFVLNAIYNYFKADLSIDSQVKINAVVFLKPSEPFVKDFNKTYSNVKDEDREISNKTFNNVFIKHAHVIFSGSTV